MNALLRKQNAASLIVATAICFGGAAMLSGHALLMSAGNVKENFSDVDGSVDFYMVTLSEDELAAVIKPIDMDNINDLKELLSECSDFTLMSRCKYDAKDFALMNADSKGWLNV